MSQKFRAGAEPEAEPQRRIGRDGALTVDDDVDRAGCAVGPLKADPPSWRPLPIEIHILPGKAYELEIMLSDLMGEVCSAKWVIDGDTFDLAPMAHILGE